MKSKTAEDLLGRSYDGGHVLMENAERAVEIAEQEAEERIRTELTRWHDPQKELPQKDVPILCKVEEYSESEYLVLRWYRSRWWIFCTSDELDGEGFCKVFDGFVVGWREIHE